MSHILTASLVQDRYSFYLSNYGLVKKHYVIWCRLSVSRTKRIIIIVIIIIIIIIITIIINSINIVEDKWIRNFEKTVSSLYLTVRPCVTKL